MVNHVHNIHGYIKKIKILFEKINFYLFIYLFFKFKFENHEN